MWVKRGDFSPADIVQQTFYYDTTPLAKVLGGVCFLSYRFLLLPKHRFLLCFGKQKKLVLYQFREEPSMKLPQIIQGGMGVGVSGYLLARAVALSGGLGTVSGVVAPHILAHILQQGDPGGHYRRALFAFPFQSIACNVLAKYFVEG